MAQKKIYVSDVKYVEYLNLPEETRKEINSKLQTLFYKELDKLKK